LFAGEIDMLLNRALGETIGNAKLASYREWLLQLFQVLEIKEGREAMLAALREVRASFSTVVGK
jgi:hypothetical protein